ncbi:hypothetical protein BKA57DRAFT_457974 [Linnemannia elongata]|nr:hypothetical protein BKA57DRAFT_457974 [Linnemannia elongata]
MTKKMIPPTLSVKSEKMGKSLSGPRLAGSLLMLSLASMTCWAKSIMTMAPNATQKNTSRKQCPSSNGTLIAEVFPILIARRSTKWWRTR